MINVNRITDIFFDLDHTLWDFEKNSALTFELIFNKLNCKVEVEKFLAITIRLIKAVGNYIEKIK